jgi:hypothetical protein
VALDQGGTAMGLTEPARVAGFHISIADDELAFGRSFTQAWATARPAIIVAGVQG